MSIVRLLTVLLLGCLLTSPARAWGPLGHAVVAELAERQLDPRAEAEVRRLLAPEGHDRLAQIASWADEIQDDPSMAALWRETRALHYVNFPRGNCHYEPPRDCLVAEPRRYGIQYIAFARGQRGEARLGGAPVRVHCTLPLPSRQRIADH